MLTAIHKRRILKLAAYIRGIAPEHFAITKLAKTLARHCGTAACVAGWAALIWPDKISLSGNSVQGDTARWLGLSHTAGGALFMPDGFGDDNAKSRFTAKRAAETLERLAETGVVQWFKKDKPVAYDAG